MKIGAKVGIKQPVLEGKVVDVEWDKKAEELRAKVSYKNDEGQQHERWFSESELKGVK